MTQHELEPLIADLWQRREALRPEPATLAPLTAALDLLDRGAARIATPTAEGWTVHTWLKQAILLTFRLTSATPLPSPWGTAFDKIPLKTTTWTEADFTQARFRMVPGAIVRHGAHIAPGAVLMPCFVNIGAYVGANTMVDTWATIGSCAQIGANCHISGGAGIGGVLEPLQAAPVIIEDECFIGARAEIAEGVVVERGAVIAMGVFLGASTKIVDRATGAVTYGRVPAYSVVVPGTLPAATGPALACAVIVKRVDAGTRAKTALNELLRA